MSLRVMPIVEAIACLVLAVWFVWSIAADSVPGSLAAASVVAAVIVVLDIGTRLWRDQGAAERRP
jgi:hypothetical protein